MSKVRISMLSFRSDEVKAVTLAICAVILVILTITPLSAQLTTGGDLIGSWHSSVSVPYDQIVLALAMAIVLGISLPAFAFSKRRKKGRA
jgi:hypothetical protein